MSFKKILNTLTPKEIVESYVLPNDLSDKEKKLAASELAIAREKRRSLMSEKDKTFAALALLRFRLEDYISNPRYDPKLHFGYFLSEYINILDKKQKDFANEIDIHFTQVSQLINCRRMPSENIIVRLEIHSGNAIPAISWLKLVDKHREYCISNDSSIRRREAKHVTHQLAIEA